MMSVSAEPPSIRIFMKRAKRSETKPPSKSSPVGRRQHPAPQAISDQDGAVALTTL